VEEVLLFRSEGANARLDHEIDIGCFLPGEEARDDQGKAGGERLRDCARACLGHDQVTRPHQVGHVIDKAECEHGSSDLHLGQAPSQLLVATAYDHELPGMGSVASSRTWAASEPTPA